MPLPKVSYSDLEDAFLFANEETRHSWLDKRTGRVLSYSDEAAVSVEEGDVDDLPDWMKPEVEAATEVLRAFGELPGQEDTCEDTDGINVEPNRYVSIEQIPSHEAFQFMAEFIQELPESLARDTLGSALRDRRPFRRFKNALGYFPNERERWFEYEARRRREYIEEWARDEGFELDFGSDVS